MVQRAVNRSQMGRLKAKFAPAASAPNAPRATMATAASRVRRVRSEIEFPAF
jgi:hypothetical protein